MSQMFLTVIREIIMFDDSMYKVRFLQIFLYAYLIDVNCQSSDENISKTIPHFRRRVEEIEDKNFTETTETDDPNGNLVSFIVNNAKEIFDDVIEKPENTTKINYTENTVRRSKIIKPRVSYQQVLTYKSTVAFTATVNVNKTSVATSTNPKYPTRTAVILYENLTRSTMIEDTQMYSKLDGINTEMSTESKLPLKNTEHDGRLDKKEREINVLARAYSSSFYQVNFSDDGTDQDPRRSCITCNNIVSEDCNDPKNKLITSGMCERDDDMCYSMHTPFGIIDRGCFNPNHNLTTYVCACNLCNYIPISEMPYMFNNKQDWVNNVIDISRTRHLRKSVYKDMACLKCEVNTTQPLGDVLDSANCLEGHIGNIPETQCEPDEVCGVKALRADGYIWRGCIKMPLYNYWWALCDYDLCNFDTIISVYDFV